MSDDLAAADRNVLINGKSVISATLDIQQEQVDVTTERERDPDWTFVDAAGHIHAYGKEFSLPTLKPVRREIACTDPDHDDECEGYAVTDHHCVICGELVVPASRQTVGQRFKPGRYSWRVEWTARVDDVRCLDRQRVSVWRTEGGRVTAFGVGQLAVESISHQGIASGSIRGAGELGQR